MRGWLGRAGAAAVLVALVVVAAHQASSPLARVAARAGFRPLVPAYLPQGLTLRLAALTPHGTPRRARSIWIWYHGTTADVVLVESPLPLSGHGEPPPPAGRERVFRWDGPGAGLEEGLIHQDGVYVAVTERGLDAASFERVVRSVHPEREGLADGIVRLLGQR